MGYNSHAIYSQISEDFACPPRSTLVTPSYIKSTGKYAECLTSYISRLANINGLSHAETFNLFIIPNTSLTKRTSFLHQDGKTYNINGAGKVAFEIQQSLSTLLTPEAMYNCAGFSFLQTLVGTSHRQVVSTHFQWCPSCLQDQNDTSTPLHIPLYWQNFSVTSCLHHKLKLHKNCVHCGNTPSPITALSISGHCNYCQNPLFGNKYTDSISAEKEDEWIADAVNHMIENRHLLKSAAQLANFRTMVSKIIGQFSSPTNAEKSLNLSTSLLYRWQHRNRPTLHQLLHLLRKLDISPTTALLNPEILVLTPITLSDLPNNIDTQKKKIT